VAPTADLDGYRARLREAFGDTLSDEFVDVLLGKLIEGLRPNQSDQLDEPTLNAGLALINSVQPRSELQALLAVQIVATGFSGLRFLRQSHRHMTEDFIDVYGSYALKLLRLAGLKPGRASPASRLPFMADQGVECTDVAEALVVLLASAMETTGTVATRKKARRCARLCASWSVKRRRSPGMLCNVIGETQAPRRAVPGITRRLIMPNWSYTSCTLMGPDADIGLSESHPFCG